MKIKSRYRNQWGLSSQRANVPHRSQRVAIMCCGSSEKLVKNHSLFQRCRVFPRSDSLKPVTYTTASLYFLCYFLLDQGLLSALKGFFLFTLHQHFTELWYGHFCQYPRCSTADFMIGFYAPINREQTDTQIIHCQQFYNDKFQLQAILCFIICYSGRTTINSSMQ